MRIPRIISVPLFCLYVAAVAYLCFASPDQVPQLPKLWFGLPSDKVGHFLMFLPYPILAYMTFASKSMTPAGSSVLMLIIMVSGIGAAIGTEKIQAMLAYRSADIKDIYADVAGILAGALCIICYIFQKKRQ